MSHPLTSSACVLLASLLLLPAMASAQVGQARYGQRYPTVGFSSQPGLVRDADPPLEGGPQRDTMGTWANLITVGLHHYLHPHFSMAAELGLGLQWMNAHTVSPVGSHPSERAFAWQVGLLGRFIPMADLEGVTLGAGMQLFNARLDDATAQQLGGELRLGWLFWRGEHTPRFGLVEVGASLPIVQGLKLPSQSIVLDEGDQTQRTAPSNWSWLRGTILLQVSF